MKRWLYLVPMALLTLWLAGCTASKNVAYIQGAGEGDEEEHVQSTQLYDARILPKDLLTITVSATDPEAVQAFNLTVPSRSTGITTSSQPQLQPYLVDNNGQINFPVLGMVTLSSLTKREAEE